jgi:hypothetical protein
VVSWNQLLLLLPFIHLHVCCRRIKRSRRHGQQDDGGSSDSDDSGDDGESDSGSDDEYGEEVCPPGCEPGLYERVVELRERRLDEEEAGAEVGKALEGIRKERELLGKKARLLEQALAAVNQVGGRQQQGWRCLRVYLILLTNTCTVSVK